MIEKVLNSVTYCIKVHKRVQVLKGKRSQCVYLRNATERSPGLHALV